MASLSFIDPILRRLPRLIPGLTPSGVSIGGVNIPDLLAGGGLLAGGAALDKEPGEVLEARQFLRNRFTSPTALSDQFSTQIGGLSSQFQPLLTQQRQRGIEDISQRFAAAFPTRVGAQGPEFGTLGRYLTNEALPREQTLLGDIGLNLLNAQERAAGRILETSKPDPTAQALSQLGGLIASQALLGSGQTINVSPTISAQGGQATGGQATGGAGGAGGGSVTSGRQIGQFSAEELARQLGRALTPQEEQAVSEAVARGITSSGTQIGDGATLGSILGTQIPGLPAGTTIGTGLGAVGAGVGGTLLGKEIGQGVFGRTSESERAGNLGGGLGALGGAALGTLIAPGIGTVIGAGLGGAAGGTAGSAAKQPDISRRETAQGALGAGLFGPTGAFVAAQGDVPTSEAVRDAVLTALGGFVGGVGGAAIVGGILGKQRGATLEKAQKRAQDLANSRSNFGHIAAFWTERLGLAGGDVDRYQQFTDQQLSEIESGPTTLVYDGQEWFEDQEGHIARAGSKLVLEAVQKLDPSITSLDNVPGFRRTYIDYLSRTITGDPGGFIQAADRGGL